MKDPHEKVSQVLVGLSENKAKAFAEGLPLINFWVWASVGTSLDEVFGEGELSRTEVFEELVKLTKSRFAFNEWLPPKVKLSFASAFERDSRTQQRSRKELYSVASKLLEEKRQKISTDKIETLQKLAESQS